MFVHNHPSGDVKPSSEDLSLTETLKKAAAAVGIAVHDHLIVGEDGCFSFREEGLL
ncbi:MAG: JAB domain-containing protein [Deltaproteobacteria bacterium]|nr:JAB domain-containing protein [Deltaproteobacteria bacterium]